MAESEDAVQAEIVRLEEAIKEKERVLVAKRKDFSDVKLSFSESEAAVAAAEKLLAAAQEEYFAAEMEKQSLFPQYERSQQNKDHHLRTEEYKKEISVAETQLREADRRIKELEAQLKDVSATYKNERERRMLMVTRVTSLVDELRAAVEHKIALTLPIDEDECSPSAQLCLNVLAELARERETTISHWTRHGRELQSVIEMKKERALELKLESERDIGLMRAAKDEEIRLAIVRFEEERAAIIRDIEELKEANEKQLQALRRTKMLSDKPSVIRSERGSTTPRRELATPAEKVLQERSADLEKEKQTLTDQIREATIERQRLLTATKELRRQIEAEETKHTSNIRNLENQIMNERNQIAGLEKENKKLKEMCDHLAATLRSGYMIH